MDEWEKYHDVVQKCKEKVKTWLDLRGNHGKHYRFIQFCLDL